MRSKKGTIASTKPKTLVVSVDRYENHPIYKKRYRITKKYHVDNPTNQEFNIGDEVTIYECRPISKLKRWTTVKPEITK